MEELSPAERLQRLRALKAQREQAAASQNPPPPTESAAEKLARLRALKAKLNAAEAKSPTTTVQPSAAAPQVPAEQSPAEKLAALRAMKARLEETKGPKKGQVSSTAPTETSKETAPRTPRSLSEGTRSKSSLRSSDTRQPVRASSRPAVKRVTRSSSAHPQAHSVAQPSQPVTRAKQVSAATTTTPVQPQTPVLSAKPKPEPMERVMEQTRPLPRLVPVDLGIQLSIAPTQSAITSMARGCQTEEVEGYDSHDEVALSSSDSLPEPVVPVRSRLTAQQRSAIQESLAFRHFLSVTAPAVESALSGSAGVSHSLRGGWTVNRTQAVDGAVYVVASEFNSRQLGSVAGLSFSSHDPSLFVSVHNGSSTALVWSLDEPEPRFQLEAPSPRVAITCAVFASCAQSLVVAGLSTGQCAIYDLSRTVAQGLPAAVSPLAPLGPYSSTHTTPGLRGGNQPSGVPVVALFAEPLAGFSAASVLAILGDGSFVLYDLMAGAEKTDDSFAADVRSSLSRYVVAVSPPPGLIGGRVTRAAPIYTGDSDRLNCVVLGDCEGSLIVLQPQAVGSPYTLHSSVLPGPVTALSSIGFPVPNTGFALVGASASGHTVCSVLSQQKIHASQPMRRVKINSTLVERFDPIVATLAGHGASSSWLLVASASGIRVVSLGDLDAVALSWSADCGDTDSIPGLSCACWCTAPNRALSALVGFDDGMVRLLLPPSEIVQACLATGAQQREKFRTSVKEMNI